MHEFRTYVVALACCAAGVAACGGGQSEEAEEAAAMKAAAPSRVQADGSIKLTDADRTALGLVAQPATEAELPNTSLRFGRVVSPPANEGQVVAPVTGRITRAPRVQLGANVAAGTTLLDIQPTLDTPERITVGTDAAVRQGDIEAAQGELDKAESDATRARALSPQVISAAQLQQAETAVATARAKLQGLQAARTAETTARTQDVAVASPIGGVVAELTVNVGALVNRGDVLARIVRPGPVWIDVAVPPDEPIGDRYEVMTTARRIAARLLTRGRITDAGGARVDRLMVDAAGATALTPGSTVAVQIGTGTMRGVILPESAIVPGVERDSVFVEAPHGIFVQRPVQIAARFGGQVRLGSGLKPGEIVVLRGGMALLGELVRGELHPAG
jgi:multidrug efflux pump subunit AcrA (membrane-fusion protein)